MISSAGFFASIPCPLLKAGFCERPHCHFNHGEQATASGDSSNRESLVTQDLDSLLEHLKKSSFAAFSESKPSTSSVTQQTYVPTPLHKLKQRKSNESTSSGDSNSGRHNKPTYIPTPIGELLKSRGERNSLDGKSQKRKGSQDSTSSTYSASSQENEIKSPEIKKSRPSLDDRIVKGKNGSSSTPEKSVKLSPAKSESKDTDLVQPVRIGKERIAHAASASIKRPQSKSTLSDVRDVMMKRYLESSDTSSKGSQATTSPSTPSLSSSSSSRVAHTPKLPSCNSTITARPKYPLDYHKSNSKVPLPMRTRHLDKLIDEYLKLYPCNEAYTQALKEEKSIFDKCTKLSYPTSIAKTIIGLRSQLKAREQAKSPSKSPTKPNQMVSHEAILNGPQAFNCSIIKKNNNLAITDCPPTLIYKFLEKFVMSSDSMKTYGYPICDPKEEGSVILPTDPKTLNNFKSNNRICCRCLKTFTVGEDGFPTRREACIYHPGRIWSGRTGGSFVKIWSCCKNETAAGGCSSSDVHIVDGSGHPEYNKGFVKTTPSKSSSDESNDCPGIYALDCEMCNTTVGMELTRLTVVDTNCKTVLEMLVKPRNAILDYNTKFSGIKEGDLDSVEDDLEAAQRKLLAIVNAKTILIGHSLDSDLKALKIVHPTVIDTAEVFPHRRGLPFKRALRTIVAEVMHQIIQENEAGHDSKEDAISCMKLMLMKATHEMHKMKNKNPNLFERLFNTSKWSGHWSTSMTQSKLTLATS